MIYGQPEFHAHTAGDLGKLKVKPLIALVVSLLLAVPGVWFCIEGRVGVGQVAGEAA